MFRNIDCNAAFKTRKNLRGNLESHIPITIYKRLYCPDWLEYSTSLVCQLLKAFYITICHIHSFLHRIIHGKGRHAGATCSSGVIQCFLSKASYDFFFAQPFTHTDETAIGSDLRFSILPKDSLTCSQGIQGLNHLPISGQLKISPEPQSPFSRFPRKLLSLRHCTKGSVTRWNQLQ